MQAETYLLLCQSYIELNPVGARMVSDPGDYPWSSYRGNALGITNAILSPHPLYLALATDDATRLESIETCSARHWMDTPLADLRMALKQDQPVGNSRFYAQIEAMTGQLREPRKRGRPRKKNEKEFPADTGQRKLPLSFN